MFVSVLSVLSVLSPVVMSKSTEMLVVGTNPNKYPGADGVAWLNIEKLDKMTLCMRFKVSQYYNLYDAVHPVIELSKANRVWSVTNKCHRDNKQCTTGIVKRFKGSYKLGKTFGIFVYNYKFMEFDSWIPGQWNSFCILMDKTKGYYAVFLNDRKMLEFADFSTDYTSPVPILNGRCACAPVHGAVTDLAVWDSLLQEQQVVSWARCRAGQGGSLIDWREGKVDTGRSLITWGNSSLHIVKLETEKLLLEDICAIQNVKPKFFKTFAVLRDYEGSINFCRNIGGEMAVARDNQTLTEMMAAVREVGLEVCGDKFFAGFSDEATETDWVEPGGESLTWWDNWQPGEPNNFGDEEDCAVVLPGTNMMFNDFTCSTKQLCSTCQLDMARLYSFQLAGVCEESQVDSFYIWDRTLSHLNGYISSVLSFSTGRARWEVSTTTDRTLLAFMNETEDFPLGVHPWYFLDSHCTDQGEDFRNLNFHLDVEQPGNFCCDDGTCIDSELVCDNVAHCQNKDDEAEGCDILRVPQYYHTNLPPFSVHRTQDRDIKIQYAEVGVAFTVLDILDINEQHSVFEIYFMIKLSWTDFKLEYEFLKDDEDKNLIQNSSRIWTPNIQYFHIKTVDSVTDYGQKLFVTKKSQPRLEEDIFTKEIYKGSENPINLVFKKRIRFTCFFESVSSYPFKEQVCQLNLYIEGSDNHLTDLKITEFRDLGPSTTGQYIIERWTHRADLRNETNERVVSLDLVLSRKLTSIFMVTYLPTLLMNIINQATNFITVENKVIHVTFPRPHCCSSLRSCSR